VRFSCASLGAAFKKESMKAIFKKRSLRDYEVTFGANVFDLSLK
jgi:hypothetical protein